MADTFRVGSAELFPTDSPLAPADLIGRSADIERLARALIGGTNLIVAGPRRTGKTSVCEAALALSASEGHYIAAVDLFRAADAAQLARDLSLSVLANRSPLRRAIRSAAGAPTKIAQLLSATATMRARLDLGEEIEIAYTPQLAQADPARALLTALELPQRIAERDDRRLVLFLDEFQEIGSGLFDRSAIVTRQLRAVLQRSPRVSTLFAGSIEHLMRDLFAPEDRALFQYGSFHQLSPIEGDEWRDGLAKRLVRDDCRITDTALERLLAASEGHPRATMLIMREAHAQAVEELVHELDDAIVRVGVERAMRSERPRHEQLVSEIRKVGRFGQLIAQRAAAGSKLYEGIAPDSANRTLNHLRDLGVVERGPRRGQWHVFDPLLRAYLRTLPVAGPIIVDEHGFE